MPQNKGNNRALDCSVMQYINRAIVSLTIKKPYDTTRCAFQKVMKLIRDQISLRDYIYRSVYLI